MRDLILHKDSRKVPINSIGLKDAQQAPTPNSKTMFSELGKETQEIAFSLMAQAKSCGELHKTLRFDIDFIESIGQQPQEELYRVIDVVMLYFINEVYPY